ncbi:AAA family ATPase [Caldichromatium japonicum]|uniref:AAA family ATPase n=1 Tax=Caldichromatium japonicum TaxID=2699430 RepID=A0A6G7VGA2_9GAMM|nr:ExeA family protein [Caldichromatium japonicum]QIK38906.1 AAA family ATPase [Caldichromatium japonicum]
MYANYFGLKEPSFSIAPDPHYLFLSDQHREALAHLLYGASENGGFVLLTGEVGTGKTTVCRAFLEQLPEGVDVALILNPVQSPNELLTNICEEFHIPLPRGKRTNKVLIDALTQYLLSAYANGRRPLLIIDEAQHLPRQALEQVRLLTNLETTKHKLLQIFLIGQPELRRMLEMRPLRQLNQRITARYHLTPLDLDETREYIHHRLAVAGVERPLFSERAIRRIYDYSGGVPRLINILCDRALLGACVTRHPQVDAGIVVQAAREVRGEPVDRSWLHSPRALAVLAVGLFTAATLMGLFAHRWLTPERRVVLADWWQGEVPFTAIWSQTQSAALTFSTGATSEGAASPANPAGPLADVQAAAVPTPDPALIDQQAPAPGASPQPTITDLALPEPEAMRLLLRRWGLDVRTLGPGDPCEHIRPFGLGCEWEQGRLSHVRFFNLPALLRLNQSEAEPRYLVLSGLSGETAQIDRATGEAVRVPVAALESAWSGDYRLIWPLPPSGAHLIRPGTMGEEARWLRELLARVPGLEMLPGPADRFDVTLESALRAFQLAKGLTPDGIAGPRTLIALYQAVGLEHLPQLAPETARQTLDIAP